LFAAKIVNHGGCQGNTVQALPDGSIQKLLGKPWICSIGQCALRYTAASAWQSKLPAISLQFLLPLMSLLATTVANNYVMVIFI
jgi:hypothetical protein